MLLIFPGVSLFSLVYSVIGREITLYWNAISDVYIINTTGQLIPFVIGLVGLAKVIYEPVKTVSCSTTLLSLPLITIQWYKKRHAESIDAVAIAGDDVESPVELVVQEAVNANHRLGYLDLSTPVDESTVHKVNKNRQLRRRI
jgi:hypothetical protein